jgi:hypothetical protein
MDIGKSFSYVFDDKDWLKKIAIGGILSIIPIVNFIPMGYSLRVIKNVSERKLSPLPEWDDWSEDFLKGLLLTVALFIYAIPSMVLGGFMGIVSAIVENGGGAEGLASVCLPAAGCLNGLWGLVLAIVVPAAMIQYATEGKFSTFFRFGEMFRLIGSNLGNYIVALLLTVVAAIVAGIVGFIICLVGLIFTGFWSTLVTSHLYGQVKADTMPAGPAAPAAPANVSYGDLTLPSQPSAEDDKPSS